jgi:hypothetical protein
MASTSGLQNNPTNNLNTIDGLQIINATSIIDNGEVIDTTIFVPYIGAVQAIDAGSQPIRTSYAPTANNDLVNLLTLQNAVAYIDGINVLNFVPYTGANSNTDLGSNNLTVGNNGQVSFSNLIKTQLNNVLAGYTPATITVGNNFGTITNISGVYQSTSTAVFASLVLGTFTGGNKYSISLSLKSVDVSNNTNLYLYGSTTPNMTGQTGSILAFSIPPNTTGFTVFTNTIIFPAGSTYLLLVYFSQKPSGIDTLYWNAYTATGMGSVVQNLIAPTNPLDATNKIYVDTQDNAVANFASATYVGYTNSFKDVDLTLVGNNSLKGYNLTATNKVIAPTAQFTAITSATPALALGVDGSGNLNTFAVPTATNILPLNNTFTGTNTFNNNLTTGDGYTNTFGNAVYTGVNAITSAVPTTTGITAAAPTPLPTISYSVPTYTCTPSGSTTYACFWSSASFTANIRYFFTFTNATTTVYAPTATLTVCQANVANSAYVAISSAYSLPSTATLFSGYFTPNLNASYVGQIFFILSNVKFTPFTWSTFSYGQGALTVQGNEIITGALSVSGRLTYAGTSTCEIYNGNIDAYNPTGNNNLMIRSWWGIGFPSYDNIVRIGMDTRTGNADFAGALTTGGNITMASGTFRKNSSANPNNWASIQEGGASNSPYMDFYYGSLRRGYIGYADASTIRLAAENNCDLNVYTGGSARMIVKNSGLTGFGRDPSYTVDINGNQRVLNGLNANDSMCYYGPNASWNAYLVVGAGTDRSGGATAQVISTNGNLHLDGGNSNSIYYGYYPNSRGTPNTHEFYGSTINFNSGLPQQDTTAIAPICFNGVRLFRSANIHNIIYSSNSVGWGGGINTTYAFYRTNPYVATLIHGKCSYYVGGATMAYPALRVYSQNTGQVWYYDLRNFTNNGGNHVTFPFQMIFNSNNTTTTGWFDVYFYQNGNCNTDTNDQLWILADTAMTNQFV